MKTQKTVILILCAVAALCRAGQAATPAPTHLLHPSAALTGATAVAELQARGQYLPLKASFETTQYLAGADAAGVVEAGNPAHALTTRFTENGPLLKAGDGAGLHWQAALQVSGYGYGTDLRPVAGVEPAALGNRVEYKRGTLTEWYVNRPQGLEQGFTLAAPPERSGAREAKLVFAMAVSGDLRAVLSDDHESVVFRDADDRRILRYGGLHVFDAKGRVLPSSLAVRDGQVAIEVDDRGAVYPVTVDPVFTTEIKLSASDRAPGDFFGFSVALSGDTAVVGAVGKDGGKVGVGADSGAAYVFARSGNAWLHQQKLIAPDAGTFRRFGWSVAISANTILIGAVLDNVGGTFSGSAYVFVRAGSVWTHQKKLIANDSSANDFFGVSAAISGDTAVLGAVGDDGVALDSGSAYVFVRSGSTWTQQQKLTANDAALGDGFGASVGVAGNTIAVGALGDDDGGANAGSAYVFVRTGTVWGLPQKVIASDAAAGDAFGANLALSGDTLLVGGPANDDAGADSGSAYVFVRTGASWSQQQKLTASDAATGDFFGSAVSLDGDAAVIGAFLANADAGAAYSFARSGGLWTQVDKLTASDGAPGDGFGLAVAIAGNAALVGAQLDKNPSNNAGSAYIFQDDTPPTISAVTASPNDLWPPNHKMVPITVSIIAADDSSGPVTCRITGIASNEPIDGTGDGDTSPDWNITGPATAEVRAERSGNGDGRIYTITVECKDAAGNASTATVEVRVAKSQRDK